MVLCLRALFRGGLQKKLTGPKKNLTQELLWWMINLAPQSLSKMIHLVDFFWFQVQFELDLLQKLKDVLYLKFVSIDYTSKTENSDFILKDAIKIVFISLLRGGIKGAKFQMAELYLFQRLYFENVSAVSGGVLFVIVKLSLNIDTL